GAARHTLETGRRLSSNKKVARAALSGELSPSQASLVANGAEAAPDKTDELLEKAKSSSLSELADEVARTKAAASDPEERRAAVHASRKLRAWTDPEGVWHLFAEGLPDDGARLHTVIGEIRRALIAARRQRGITGETFQALDYDSLLTLIRVALGTEAELSLADLYHRGLFPGLDDIVCDVDASPSSHDPMPEGPSAAVPRTSTGSDPAAPGASPPDAASASVASHSDDSPRPGTLPSPVSGLTSLFEQPDGFPAEPRDPSEGARPDPASGLRSTDGAPASTLGGAGSPAPASTRPGSGGNRPPKRRRSRPLSAQIQVRVDLDTLMRGVAVEGELCEIVGYGPVPVSVVEDLVANDATFIVAILTKAQRVAGVAHFGRAPNAYQDSALSFIYPRCAVAGCNNRVFLQRDHREDWARTHVTVFDWMDRLCTHHHRLKTTQGWALVAGRGKRAFVPPTDPRHPRHRPPERPSCNSEGVIPGLSPPLAGTG
ncbi:MAG TPA: hypothetical protein VKU88_01695, partial [Acidimicrobiales bacterium]|nr:hypothetical protein [Acidimicrobiales bacterium]